MLSAAAILRLHDAANAHGHDAALPAPTPPTDLAELILQQHRANFDLWHQEDEARDPHATDTAIVAAKRAIDRLNQLRNDLVEHIDERLLSRLPAAGPGVPLHSETPGLIIDRLSILSLKLFHTEQQLHRSSPSHRERNRARLAVLTRQRDDLAQCLDLLWADLLAGRRRFQLYRQLKMYNDPTLNPVLYRKTTS
jgi:hypothetical protein